DIEYRRPTWSFLRKINREGTTIILTAHYLEEAEALCRNIAIINHGRIAERAGMKDLLEKLHTETFVLDLAARVDALPTFPGYAVTQTDPTTLEVEMRREQSMNELFGLLTEKGIRVISMRNKVNRVEELFVRLVENSERRAWTEMAMSRLKKNLVGMRTIIRREFTRVLRIWVQTIVPPAITMTLYFIIFGSLIGRRIGEIGGHDYMSYIAPGLIMMSIITNSYSIVASSFFGAKFGMHIEERLVSPLPSQYILIGYVMGGVLRGLLVGAVVTGVALFFTDLDVKHPLITLSTVLLTAIVFSLGGFINAVFSRKFDDISIVPTFILTPLTYLGGVFYSIELLPEFWESLSRANPILYMVNAFRFGILGSSDIGIGTAYAIIIGFVVALYSFSLYLMNRGVGMRT